jgi:hypothetical protein
MSRALLAALLAVSAVASTGTVQAQSRSDVRQIEQDYARTHNGRAISDSQLEYYIDQMGRGWSMAQVRADMSGGRSNQGWRPRQDWNATSVICSSVDRRYTECRVPFRGTARITSQISDASCVRGRSWGEKPGVVWVDRGCRARFSVQGGNGHGNAYGNGNNHGYGNGNDDGRWGSDYVVTCSSVDNQRVRCDWDERYGAPQINKQLSESRCTAGRTWDYDTRDLWVSNGCRATFIPLGNHRR